MFINNVSEVLHSRCELCAGDYRKIIHAHNCCFGEIEYWIPIWILSYKEHLPHYFPPSQPHRIVCKGVDQWGYYSCGVMVGISIPVLFYSSRNVQLLRQGRNKKRKKKKKEKGRINPTCRIFHFIGENKIIISVFNHGWTNNSFPGSEIAPHI